MFKLSRSARSSIAMFVDQSVAASFQAAFDAGGMT